MTAAGYCFDPDKSIRNDAYHTSICIHLNPNCISKKHYLKIVSFEKPIYYKVYFENKSNMLIGRR